MVAPLASLAGIPSATVPDANAAQIQKIKDTAQAFESILLRQMLREVRQSSIVSKPETSQSAYLQMADEQMANHLAAQGGFGFGKAMADQLIRQVSAAQLIKSPPVAVKP